MRHTLCHQSNVKLHLNIKADALKLSVFLISDKNYKAYKFSGQRDEAHSGQNWKHLVLKPAMTQEDVI